MASQEAIFFILFSCHSIFDFRRVVDYADQMAFVVQMSGVLHLDQFLQARMSDQVLFLCCQKGLSDLVLYPVGSAEAFVRLIFLCCLVEQFDQVSF